MGEGLQILINYCWGNMHEYNPARGQRGAVIGLVYESSVHITVYAALPCCKVNKSHEKLALSEMALTAAQRSLQIFEDGLGS